MSKPSKRRFRTLARWGVGSLAALGVVMSAAPAAADWLVLTDGTRIETDGPWSERGRLVVFTDTSGNLMSMKLSEVDLDASRDATEAAERAVQEPPPPPPPPKASVFSITDADVGHLDDDEFMDADETSEDELELSLDLDVRQWEIVDNATADGQAVQGTLENSGDDAAAGITIQVTAFDIDGEQLGSSSAQLGSGSLMPGETTRLVADFPGVFDISAVNFEIKQQRFVTRLGEAEAEEE